jgi:hypothetical protein
MLKIHFSYKLISRCTLEHEVLFDVAVPVRSAYLKKLMGGANPIHVCEENIEKSD